MCCKAISHPASAISPGRCRRGEPRRVDYRDLCESTSETYRKAQPRPPCAAHDGRRWLIGSRSFKHPLHPLHSRHDPPLATNRGNRLRLVVVAPGRHRPCALGLQSVAVRDAPPRFARQPRLLPCVQLSLQGRTQVRRLWFLVVACACRRSGSIRRGGQYCRSIACPAVRTARKTEPPYSPSLPPLIISMSRKAQTMISAELMARSVI